MTIQTTPVFYYVQEITKDNYRLNYNEGAGELTAVLNVNDYTMEGLVTEVARAMTEYGTQEYTATLNRTTRKVTISAPGVFDILSTSGSAAGTSVLPILGFTGADQVGASSYESDTQMGSEYIPQFPLINYRSFIDSLEGVKTSINESANGDIEVITFGQRSFMEFKIMYITDRPTKDGNVIINNIGAVQEARDFLTFCISKNKLEFMEDKDNRAVFTKCLLESTQESGSGTGFRLKEMLSNGLLDYYETGKLKFRKVI